MARPLRIDVAGGWYHVSARGIERREICRTDADREHWVGLLGELAARFRLRVHAWVLMDNHYHLQVETPEANLSAAIQWLNVAHAVWFGHDAAGRVIAATDPLNRTVRTALDADGRPVAVTNALGYATRTFYDERGLAVETRDALNQSIGSGYDANGNRTALTNRLANGWSFAFDANNRLLSTTSPLGRTWSQTYNSRGLVATVTEPSTQSATLLYNNRGWLSSRADSLGTVTNTFDANGNVLTVKEGAATITRHYDALNRVTNYINAAGASIRYTYDAASNLTSLRYPDGKTVTYAYDAHNRLASVTDWASRVTSFTYDLNGRLTRMDRPNGTFRTLTYDAANQVREIAEKKANGRLIALFRLDYDAGGRPSYEFTVPKPQTWALPELDATADADNRLAAVNGQSVTHDADGNMTAGFVAQGTNAEMVAASFGYDARNRLTSVAVGSTNVTYAYDAEGHRTRMAVNSVTNNFTINPHAPLSQVLVTEASGAQTFYVHGAGLLYEVQPSGAVRYYHYDLRGSTVAMSDESGTVTDRFEYSPYGTMTHREGGTQTPFGYNGAFGVMADAAGLLHMRARFYNPGLRRFVNEDPIGFAGGMNWYEFANGNPILLTDPDGEHPILIAMLIGAMIGAAIDVGATYAIEKTVGDGASFADLRTAAIRGAISGSISAVATPVAGSIIRGLGGSASGLFAKGTSMIVSGAGSSLGQRVANDMDPGQRDRDQGVAVAFLGGVVGQGLANAIVPATRGFSTVLQASYFGPQSVSSFFATANARTVSSSVAVSSITSVFVGLGASMDTSPSGANASGTPYSPLPTLSMPTWPTGVPAGGGLK